MPRYSAVPGLQDSDLRPMGPPESSVELPLESIAEGLWRAQPRDALGGVVAFDAAGFRFSSYMMRSLPFRRTT